MAMEILVNYLRQNKDKYFLDDLKEKILSKGYSEIEFNDALEEVNSDSEVASRMSEGLDSFRPKPVEGSIEIKKSRLLKISFISGFTLCGLILLMALLTLFSFQGNAASFQEVLSSIVCLISILCFLIVMVGMYKLGTYLDSKILRVASAGISFFFVVLTLVSFLGYGSGCLMTFLGLIDFSILNFYFYVVLGLVIAILILHVFLFVGFVGFEKHLKFSFLSGVLGLMSSILLFINVGVLAYSLLRPEGFIGSLFSGISRGTHLILLSFICLVLVFFESLVLLSGHERFE